MNVKKGLQTALTLTTVAAGSYLLAKKLHHPREHGLSPGEMAARFDNETILNLSAYPNYREELIPSAGSRIALSLYPAGKEKPCVVFLPGTMTHPLLYDEFLSGLARNGFNVVGVHYISHGKSPRERALFTFDDMLQNVKDAISFAIQEYNQQIILMGSSQGGILSMACACEDKRVKAVFPHNILLPSLPDSIRVTRFPAWLKPCYTIIPHLMNVAAWVMPALQLPITTYLELERIFTVAGSAERFLGDPLSLRTYPLRFLASLFSADLGTITDGSLQCPVVVIASTGDPLFSFDYCQQVYDLIDAPHKEMLVFDEPHHLILNEAVGVVLDPIVAKLRVIST